MAQIPIHEGLFTWPAAHPQLLGSRCVHCAQVAFPAQRSCRACSGTATEIIELGDRGTLWTWTIQRFMPKPPYRSDATAETFRPYGVGYVEMPGGVRVEARLCDNESLRIGLPMQLVIEKFRTDANGNDIMTFAFRATAQENTR